METKMKAKIAYGFQSSIENNELPRGYLILLAVILTFQ